VLCGMMALIMSALVFSGRMPQGPQGPPLSPRMMIPSLSLYVVIAVACIWLGIGMIRARRSAWTLTLVISWMGLIVGLFAAVMMQFVMGGKSWDALAAENHMPPDMARIMWMTTTLTTIGLYVILPGIFVVLCQPKSVRDTVYRCDPTPRWTDSCPMPVLAVCLLLAFSVVWMPSMAAYNWMMPLFGYVLSGPAGAIAIGVLAILLALLAWGNYRLKLLAWWGTLVFSIVSGVSSAMMFWRGDILAMYEKMGLPAEQIEMIRKTCLLETMTRLGPWMNLGFAAAWLGYLIYIRRYFVRRSEIARLAP
jgi:hypothetical protein